MPIIGPPLWRMPKCLLTNNLCCDLHQSCKVLQKLFGLTNPNDWNYCNNATKTLKCSSSEIFEKPESGAQLVHCIHACLNGLQPSLNSLHAIQLSLIDLQVIKCPVACTVLIWLEMLCNFWIKQIGQLLKKLWWNNRPNSRDFYLLASAKDIMFLPCKEQHSFK